MLSMLVPPKSEPEAGVEDDAEAELLVPIWSSRLKSKSSSSSSMAELGDAMAASNLIEAAGSVSAGVV